MIVGVLKMDLMIFDARSLKDKRRVIQSVKQKLHNKFNVSVAEVAYQDQSKRCTLGVAVVGTGSRIVEAQIDRVVDMIRGTIGLSLIDYERELL